MTGLNLTEIRIRYIGAMRAVDKAHDRGQITDELANLVRTWAADMRGLLVEVDRLGEEAREQFHARTYAEQRCDELAADVQNLENALGLQRQERRAA
jgi:hypothetical protein